MMLIDAIEKKLKLCKQDGDGGLRRIFQGSVRVEFKFKHVDEYSEHHENFTDIQLEVLG